MITIENCTFAYKCPKSWHDLKKLDGALSVRYCSACERRVHYCAVDGELMERVRAGDCVAIMRTIDPVAGPTRPNSSLVAKEPMWLGVILRNDSEASLLSWDD